MLVNDVLIDADYFVQGFIDYTVSGMVEALEGTGKIKDLNLEIDGDKVSINLNGDTVQLDAFANKIIRSTIVGMISALKGVNDIGKLGLVLHK
jgi:hypothetical protein